jgi:hypothetical protein
MEINRSEWLWISEYGIGVTGIVVSPGREEITVSAGKKE